MALMFFYIRNMAFFSFPVFKRKVFVLLYLIQFAEKHIAGLQWDIYLALPSIKILSFENPFRSEYLRHIKREDQGHVAYISIVLFSGTLHINQYKYLTKIFYI